MGEILIKGFSFGYMAERGEFLLPESEDSLNKLQATGTDWVALCVVQKTEGRDALQIRFDYKTNLTDHEVEHMIQLIHDRNMKVCLKPMINCENEWRAKIDFGTDKKAWNIWFNEYDAYILHYAEIAERTGCEMLCIGCEMLGTERQEAHWRALITKVREVYKGFVTYNTNHGKEMIAAWYDALDYIGTSAYYPVAANEETSIDEMKSKWRVISSQLQNLYERYRKPIIFMEIGCRSAHGCASMPWDFEHKNLEADEQEQADFYESCLSVMQDVTWFAGLFWWDWSCDLYSVEEAHEDRGFAIYGKKAEQVLKKYYGK